MKVYRADLSGSKGRIVPAVWIIILFVSAIVIDTCMFIPKYTSNNPGRTAEMIWFMIGVYSLFAFLILGFVIPLFLERKTASFKVILDNDEVKAFKIDKTKTVMPYRSIVSIKAVKNPWFALFAKNVKVSDRDGNSIFIHYNIRRLGECIEAIRKAAVNCETVNYAGLEKSIYWNRE